MTLRKLIRLKLKNSILSLLAQILNYNYQFYISAYQVKLVQIIYSQIRFKSSNVNIDNRSQYLVLDKCFFYYNSGRDYWLKVNS